MSQEELNIISDTLEDIGQELDESRIPVESADAEVDAEIDSGDAGLDTVVDATSSIHNADERSNEDRDSVIVEKPDVEDIAIGGVEMETQDISSEPTDISTKDLDIDLDVERNAFDSGSVVARSGEALIQEGNRAPLDSDFSDDDEEEREIEINSMVASADAKPTAKTQTITSDLTLWTNKAYIGGYRRANIELFHATTQTKTAQDWQTENRGRRNHRDTQTVKVSDFKTQTTKHEGTQMVDSALT